MAHKFKIGDKVMADFGKYGNHNWKIDTIVGETKTLWKCGEFSFSKVNRQVRGLGEWHFVYASHYDEERIAKDVFRANVWKNWKRAMDKLATINTNTDFDLMQKFIDWTNENIKEK